MSKYLVQFSRGPKEAYNIYSSEDKKSIIYFAEDTKDILLDNESYGANLSTTFIDAISQVELQLDGSIKFTNINGKVTYITIPAATDTINGLLSAKDKKFLDSIPDTYVTKEELKETTSRVYNYKGTVVNYGDLPLEDNQVGDTYNVLNAFNIGDDHYAAGTNVAWDGESWDPLGGISDTYSKAEIDAKFEEQESKFEDMFIWHEIDANAVQSTENTNTIDETLKDGVTSSVDVSNNGITKNIIIPSTAKSGAIVTANLDENSTITSTKTVTIVNTSETPSNVTIDSTSTVTLKGNYNKVTTNGSVKIIEGQANSVNVLKDTQFAITINANDQDILSVNSASEKEVTISGSTKDLTINANTVVLSGTYDKVISNVSSGTINQGTTIDTLVLRKGNVVVKDSKVENIVNNVIREGNYTVSPYTTEATNWTEFNRGATTPGVTKVQEDIDNASGVVFGVVASGNYQWDINKNITGGSTKTGMFLVRGSANLDITGDGNIINNAGTYGLWNAGTGTVNIYGGNWEASTHAVYAEKGTINIYGGTFKEKNNDFAYLLNCYDANYKNKTAKIVVYGGTFYDFNPQDNTAEGPGTNFVAEGYSVTSELIDNHIIYKVHK